MKQENKGAFNERMVEKAKRVIEDAKNTGYITQLFGKERFAMPLTEYSQTGFDIGRAAPWKLIVELEKLLPKT